MNTLKAKQEEAEKNAQATEDELQEVSVLCFRNEQFSLRSSNKHDLTPITQLTQPTDASMTYSRLFRSILLDSSWALELQFPSKFTFIPECSELSRLSTTLSFLTW